MLVQSETNEVLVLVLPEPVPFPTDLDAYEEHVEAVAPEAEQFPVVFSPLTSDDAAKAARRRAYWMAIAADMARPFDEEIARLRGEAKRFLDEAGRLEFEKQAAVKPYERKARWYEAPLEAFMRAMNKANDKIKTWPTPFGKLSVTKQQPEWSYGGDKATEEAIGWRLHGLNEDLVKLVPAIDKKALKEAAKVVDGKVYVTGVTDDGEVRDFELEGVAVIDRQPKFEIK